MKKVPSKKVDLELVLKAIGDEPELPGEMPDSIWNEVKKGKQIATIYFRMAVSVTKSEIRERILKELERKSKK